MNEASVRGAAWAFSFSVVMHVQRPICALAEEVSFESQAIAKAPSVSRNPNQENVLRIVLIVAVCPIRSG